MSSSTSALDIIETLPNKGGFSPLQLEMMRKIGHDIDRIDDRMDILKEQFDTISGKVDNLSEKMDLVLAQLKTAEVAETKFNFVQSIMQSKRFWIFVGFIIILILGEKAEILFK